MRTGYRLPHVHIVQLCLSAFAFCMVTCLGAFYLQLRYDLVVAPPFGLPSESTPLLLAIGSGAAQSPADANAVAAAARADPASTVVFDLSPDTPGVGILDPTGVLSDTLRDQGLPPQAFAEPGGEPLVYVAADSYLATPAGQAALQAFAGPDTTVAGTFDRAAGPLHTDLIFTPPAVPTSAGVIHIHTPDPQDADMSAALTAVGMLAEPIYAGSGFSGLLKDASARMTILVWAAAATSCALLLAQWARARGARTRIEWLCGATPARRFAREAPAAAATVSVGAMAGMGTAYLLTGALAQPGWRTLEMPLAALATAISAAVFLGLWAATAHGAWRGPRAAP